jgi:hypothetical protein
MIWLELLVMNHEIMGSSLEFTNLFLIFLKKRGGREKKKEGESEGEAMGGRGARREGEGCIIELIYIYIYIYANFTNRTVEMYQVFALTKYEGCVNKTDTFIYIEHV